MELSIKIQNEPSFNNNEILISPRSLDNKKTSEIFFCWEGNLNSDYARELAYYYQNIFLEQTGSYLPAVGYRSTNHESPPFFVPTDEKTK